MTVVSASMFLSGSMAYEDYVNCQTQGYNYMCGRSGNSHKYNKPSSSLFSCVSLYKMCHCAFKKTTIKVSVNIG